MSDRRIITGTYGLALLALVIASIGIGRLDVHGAGLQLRQSIVDAAYERPRTNGSEQFFLAPYTVGERLTWGQLAERLKMEDRVAARLMVETYYKQYGGCKNYSALKDSIIPKGEIFIVLRSSGSCGKGNR